MSDDGLKLLGTTPTAKAHTHTHIHVHAHAHAHADTALAGGEHAGHGKGRDRSHRLRGTVVEPGSRVRLAERRGRRWELSLSHAHGPERSAHRLGRRGGHAGAGRENSPGVDSRQVAHEGRLGPHATVGARKKNGLANDVGDTRRRGQQGLVDGQQVRLNLLTLSVEKLSSTFLLETLKGGNICAEDKFVDGLDEILVKLLALLLLLGPVVCVCLGVDTVNLLVVLDESINGVGSQLVSNLVAQNHVNMDDVSFNVNQLMVEGVLHGVLGHVSLGDLGEHDGGQSPDGICVGKSLCQASLMLGDAVERALYTVDSLECLCKPRLNLGS